MRSLAVMVAVLALAAGLLAGCQAEQSAPRRPNFHAAFTDWGRYGRVDAESDYHLPTSTYHLEIPNLQPSRR